jgi:hypothetical protein
MTNQLTLRTATEGCTFVIVGDVYRFMATGEDTKAGLTQDLLAGKVRVNVDEAEEVAP